MLHIAEDHVEHRDDGRSYGLGSSEVYETHFEDDEIGVLFRACQRAHGRCLSRVYVDRDTGPRVIGWVFQRRRKYEDDPRQTYMHEVWISVHAAPPTRTVEYHYAEVAR